MPLGPLLGSSGLGRWRTLNPMTGSSGSGTSAEPTVTVTA